LRTFTLATGRQRREISPVEQRLVERHVMDSLELNRRAFHRKPPLEQVNGNVWDHGLPEREHTPDDLQSGQTMPAVPQRDARLADADARV
jgi:hypothetical protein